MRKTKKIKGGNGPVSGESVSIKKEPLKGMAPVFSSPANLAQRLRNLGFAMTPIIVHLEGQKCPLIAGELGKLKAKLEENADYISEVGRLGQQKDLFAPKEKLPSDSTLAKTLFSKKAPKKPGVKSLAAGGRAEA